MELKGKIDVKFSQNTKQWSGVIKGNDDKTYSVPKGFDFNQFTESKKLKSECSFKAEGNKATAIAINGKPVPKDSAFEAEKKAQQIRKAKNSESRKQEQVFEAKMQRQQNRQKRKEYNLLDTFLPKDTFETLLLNEKDSVDNFSLKLNRTANFPEPNKPAVIYRNDRKFGELKYYVSFNFLEDANLAERQLNSISRMFNDDHYKSFVFDTDGRLVVGLGGDSVFETSMTLHHVYGIPYIPASSIKGVIRSWIITQIEDYQIRGSKYSEAEALKDKLFCDLFGCPEYIMVDKKKQYSYYGKLSKVEKAISGSQKGNIIFFDAFPVNVPTIKEDIMTVHYPDYYGQNKAPTDFQKPNPIPFLTVEKTKFCFSFAIRKNISIAHESRIGVKATPLDIISHFLQQALENHGVGAKTAVGYGYFQKSA